jgi:hypothetical protein
MAPWKSLANMRHGLIFIFHEEGCQQKSLKHRIAKLVFAKNYVQYLQNEDHFDKHFACIHTYVSMGSIWYECH